MYFDFTELSDAECYHLTTQTVMPRPVAWILSEFSEKNYNLAPFSYFTPITNNPPLLMVSVGTKPGGELKDTIKNMTFSKKMVIHIASADLAEQVTLTAKDLPQNKSEVDLAKLELVDFEGFDMPRLKDCSIAYGCSLYEIKEIGNKPQSLLFAQVEKLYVADEMVSLEEDKVTINAKKINPLARLGGNEYANLKDVFAIARPQ
ncbi:MAG: flavin reductase family protein [Flavobacteriales bacterium]|nr:flavin reductase family protein [Flavobacteriales bacterium]